MRRTLTVVFMFVMLVVTANPGSAQGLERADIIVRGGWVVTMDAAARVIENGAVVVRRERIVEVGPWADG